MAARGRPADLILAARLDPAHQPALRRALAVWRKQQDPEAVLDALRVLQPPLSDAEAAAWLDWCLCLAGLKRPQLGRRAVAFFRERHPVATLRYEATLLRRHIESPYVASVAASKIGALLGLGPVITGWPDQWMQIARERRYAAGQHHSALQLLQAALQLGPELQRNQWFFYIRGLVFQALKRYREAIDDFDRCFSLDKNAAALIHKAITLMLAGRNDEALALLRSIEPQMAREQSKTWIHVVRFHWLVIEAEAGQGDARAKLEKMLRELSPGWYMAFANQYPPAVWILQRVVRLLPASAFAAAHLGSELFYQRRPTEALPLLQRAAASLPRSWPRAAQIGRLLEQARKVGR